MKIRNLFIGLVLAMMVMFAGSSRSSTTQAFGCNTFCSNNANACMSACNGDPACENQCKADFDCCLLFCQGRGDECP